MLCASSAPAGYSANNTDCNDSDDTVNTPQQYYVDADGDGFGSTTTAMLCASSAPAGYSANNTDCNDSDDTVNPNATEIPGNAIDEDCDGEAQTALSNEKFDVVNISVSPNPFSDHLTVNLPIAFRNDTFNIKIYDINGRKVIHRKTLSLINNKLVVSNLNELSQGAYFIKITNLASQKSVVKQIIRF
ncbi:T9SS type A sorting domain-containing protein, partial [Hyunsoonleella aestuarii]|uniref:Secretion system C-terminal sorting domain-containing protein n=2 Tax=Hyunsoonleella aestuarii TaxID=912802 RepID=A0ABP8EEN7_9FLAO